MKTLSPLHIIHKELSQNIEGSKPLPEEQHTFGYNCTFPETSHDEQPSMEYSLWLHWDQVARRLMISSPINSAGFFAPWEDMRQFFIELTDNVQPFLDIEWPGGELTPFPVNEKNPAKLAPGYQAKLICPKQLDEEGLLRQFHVVQKCSAQALLFIRPIFKEISTHGRVPSVHERMRMLSIEFGRYKLYHQPQYGRPVMFPRGWYDTRRANPAEHRQ